LSTVHENDEKKTVRCDAEEMERRNVAEIPSVYLKRIQSKEGGVETRIRVKA